MPSFGLRFPLILARVAVGPGKLFLAALATVIRPRSPLLQGTDWLHQMAAWIGRHRPGFSSHKRTRS
jgi:hypothetical protein